MITGDDLNKIKAEKGNEISEAYRDENGYLVRTIEGKEIKQIEEKTEADKRLNEAINLWRMRSK
jgi:hypothetical protein